MMNANQSNIQSSRNETSNLSQFSTRGSQMFETGKETRGLESPNSDTRGSTAHPNQPFSRSLFTSSFLRPCSYDDTQNTQPNSFKDSFSFAGTCSSLHDHFQNHAAQKSGDVIKEFRSVFLERYLEKNKIGRKSKVLNKLPYKQARQSHNSISKNSESIDDQEGEKAVSTALDELSRYQTVNYDQVNSNVVSKEINDQIQNIPCSVDSRNDINCNSYNELFYLDMSEQGNHQGPLLATNLNSFNSYIQTRNGFSNMASVNSSPEHEPASTVSSVSSSFCYSSQASSTNSSSSDFSRMGQIRTNYDPHVDYITSRETSNDGSLLSSMIESDMSVSGPFNTEDIFDTSDLVISNSDSVELSKKRFDFDSSNNLVKYTNTETFPSDQNQFDNAHLKNAFIMKRNLASSRRPFDMCEENGYVTEGQPMNLVHSDVKMLFNFESESEYPGTSTDLLNFTESLNGF